MTDQPDIVVRLRDFEEEGITRSDLFHLRNDAAAAIEDLRANQKRAAIPTCVITGLIAGDTDACGDCDPCGAADRVPDVVMKLLAEKDEWKTKYGEAMASLEGERERCAAIADRWGEVAAREIAKAIRESSVDKPEPGTPRVGGEGAGWL